MADLKLLTCISLSLVLAASLAEQKHFEGGISNDHNNESSPFCDPESDFDFDCGVGELRTRCISALWHCDNVHDCTSGKDEIGCNYLHKCAPGTFICTNGDCYLATKRCDGNWDCPNGRDEEGCPKNTSNVNDNVNAASRAEAIVGIDEADKESSDSSSGLFWIVLVLFTLVAVAIILFCCLMHSARYPETSSRVDQALKDLNRNVGSSARKLISAGRGAFASSSSHVTMSSPVRAGSSTSANNDQHFFDNPMNTLPYQSEPLLLRVPSASSLHQHYGSTQQQQPPTV